MGELTIKPEYFVEKARHDYSKLADFDKYEVIIALLAFKGLDTDIEKLSSSQYESIAGAAAELANDLQLTFGD